MSGSRKACTVHVNRHDRLFYRLYVNGQEWKEGTGLRDNGEHRVRVERAAERIARAIRDGTFSYLRFFPRGNRAHEFAVVPTRRDQPRLSSGRPTVEEFFTSWEPTLAPPKVRKATGKQYRSALRRHILPTLRDLHLDALTWRDLASLQDDLRAAGVGAAAVNRALHHALRAMLRDARKRYAFIATDLYDRALWQRLPEDPDSDPNPYDEAERKLILRHFRKDQSHWYALVFFQFWQGLRPSEAFALRRVDVDLRYGAARVARSRVGSDEGKTKNQKSKRTVRLHLPTVEVLNEVWPIHSKPMDYVFTTTTGGPVTEGNFYQRIWLPALRRLKVRERPFYNTRHSYISYMLSIGKKLAFVSEQTGHGIRTLEKHYKKYLPQDDDLTLPFETDSPDAANVKTNRRSR
ncbi:MAG: Arm DNA-binding domain-containing protein [Candidatus Binatia bacterium]